MSVSSSSSWQTNSRRSAAVDRRTVTRGALVAAALALLLYGYHFVQEARMFPWSARTTAVTENRPLPAIDLAAPAVVETATFAVG